jgi:hypothetical protein
MLRIGPVLLFAAALVGGACVPPGSGDGGVTDAGDGDGDGDPDGGIVEDAPGTLLTSLVSTATGTDGAYRYWPRDADGVELVAGFFGGLSTLFGDAELFAVGEVDLYVTRLDDAGEALWTRTIGSAGEDVVDRLACGPAGIAVCGSHVGPLVIDGVEVRASPAGQRGGFAAFFNDDGTLLDLATHEGGADDVDQALRFCERASDGSMTLVGNWRGDGRVLVGIEAPDVIELGTADGVDAFVLQLAADHTVTSEARIEGAGIAGPASVAVMPGGDLLLVGGMDSEAIFGAGTDDETTLTVSGGFAPVLARMHPDGTLRWAMAGQTVGAFAYVWSADARDGRIAVVGHFSGALTLPTTAGEGPVLTSQANADTWVALYDDDGALQWARHISGPQNEFARAVALSPDGQLALTGMFGKSPASGEQPTSTRISVGEPDEVLVEHGSQGGRWMTIVYAPDGTIAWRSKVESIGSFGFDLVYRGDRLFNAGSIFGLAYYGLNDEEEGVEIVGADQDSLVLEVVP